MLPGKPSFIFLSSRFAFSLFYRSEGEISKKFEMYQPRNTNIMYHHFMRQGHIHSGGAQMKLQAGETTKRNNGEVDGSGERCSMLVYHTDDVIRDHRVTPEYPGVTPAPPEWGAAGPVSFLWPKKQLLTE